MVSNLSEMSSTLWSFSLVSVSCIQQKQLFFDSNDLLMYGDAGGCSVLVLLDLSADWLRLRQWVGLSGSLSFICFNVLDCEALCDFWSFKDGIQINKLS